jgi:hypothetical protein
VQNVAGYHSICVSKYEWGKGQIGGKNWSGIFELTAMNFFGRFNIFLFQQPRSFWGAHILHGNIPTGCILKNP